MSTLLESLFIALFSSRAFILFLAFKGGLFVCFFFNKHVTVYNEREIFYLKKLCPDMKEAMVTCRRPFLLQCRIMWIQAKFLNFLLYYVVCYFANWVLIGIGTLTLREGLLVQGHLEEWGHLINTKKVIGHLLCTLHDRGSLLLLLGETLTEQKEKENSVLHGT